MTKLINVNKLKQRSLKENWVNAISSSNINNLLHVNTGRWSKGLVTVRLSDNLPLKSCNPVIWNY